MLEAVQSSKIDRRELDKKSLNTTSTWYFNILIYTKYFLII